MFVKKLFTYLPAYISKSKRCFNVKFSIYLFHIKTKILADFQICISVPLIPKWLFGEIKLVVIRLPFAFKNEKFSMCFISKLQSFTNGKVKFHIIWNTSKIQSLFNNKDKVQHLSWVIYKGVCSCGADYIG